MRKTAIILFVILNLLALRTAYAQTPAVTTGLNYLYSVQNADGSWGSAASQKEALPATVSVIETFQALNETDKTSYTNAVSWLQGQSVNTTEYLSERMLNLKTAAADQETLLAYIDSLSNAWGGYDDYGVSIIDTALALQALKAANYSDATVINQALYYLTNKQNTDGGWGLIAGAESSTYVTAIVSATLQQFTQTATLATAVNKATSYLRGHQNSDGGFGSSPSTVCVTALAYKALAPLTTDNTVLGNAVNYLTISQSANGSWNDDPYSTALALQALHLSENRPAPLPSPTSGTVSGMVVDGATNQPLNGVAIQLSGDGAHLASTSHDGTFGVTNVPAGSYQISLSVNGYSSYSETATVGAGSIINLGTILLSAIPSFGMIQGTLTDASTGLPLSGAAITITGSSSWSATTAADGSFKLAGITPGSVTVSASMTGYYTVTGTGTITAGGTLTFSPALSTSPPVATTGGIKGKVTDSATGVPIQGALVTITPAPSGTGTLATDAAGIFALSSMEPGTYTAAINATNYTGQIHTIAIVAGAQMDFGAFTLSPIANTTTVFGMVTDAATGSPLENATIAVVGTVLSATTAADGTYTLNGISAADFTLRASAVGYGSLSYSVSAKTYVVDRINLSLSQSKASTLRILSVAMDRGSYAIDTDAVITASIENSGDAAADALMTAVVTDAEGNVLAMAGPAEPRITLASSSTTTVTMIWNTGQTGQGNYAVTVKASEPGTAGYGNPLGNILAERSTMLVMNASSEIEGSLSLNPPVSQAGMLTPVAVTAAVRNTGNIPLAPVMRLEVTREGTPVYAREITMPELPVNTVSELDLGAFTAYAGGNYSVRLKPVDTTIVSNITKTLYVGPNATATFTATPAKALAGNVKVAARIHVAGRGVSGAVQDPMVPLIKSAIQKAVYSEQQTVMRWHNTHKCYGCHIQAQGLVGLERSRDKVLVDESASNALFTAFKDWQLGDGSIDGCGYAPYTGYLKTMTQLGLWALTSWHDQNEAKPYILKAADFLLAKQNSSGSWTADLSGGWWGDEASATGLSMVGIAQAYRLSNDAKYLASLTKAAQYLGASNRVSPDFYMVSANQIIGLQAVVDVLQDAALLSQVQAIINSALLSLKSAQRSDGGWGRWRSEISDPLVSAQALYAIVITGTPGDDVVLKKAIQYLLNTQGSDGAWRDTVGFFFTTTVAATTWAAISLPFALERVGGIDAETHIVFPTNVSLSSAEPPPTSQDGSEYTWNLAGVDEAGRDITLDLTVQGLDLHETRPLAQQAYLSFSSAYTGEVVKTNIEIPKIAGAASETISVSTDKPVYGADEDVAITTAFANDSAVVQSPLVRLFIEDSAGKRVAQAASFTASAFEPSVFPGWAYRIPATITSSPGWGNKIAGLAIDFSSALTALGLSGKTVDQNSIRVVERDASNNLLGEKQATALFSGPHTATVSWYVDGVTGANATRYFQIYFDTTDHGAKEASLNTAIPKTGSLIAYVDNGGNIYVAENKRDGAFGAQQLVGDVSAAEDNSRGIVLEDFNGDGFVDFVTGSGSDGRLYYYQNKADGTNTFNSQLNIGVISTNTCVMGMTAADFNNDGKKDFVVSGHNTSLYLFKGSGNGAFTRTTLPAPVGTVYLRGKAVLDLDGDGKIDLLVADYSSGDIFLYKGRGDGSFETPVKVGSCGWYTDPYGLIVGDFNEDGKIDIIANVGGLGESYLFIGNGNASFGSPIYIASLYTGSYAGFAAGDFNTDGHLDVVVSNYSGIIEFYPGRGNGLFGSSSSIGATTNAAFGISASPPLAEVRPIIGSPEIVPVRTYSFTWNTGGTPPDNYRVHAVLDEGNETISESYASFAITPDIRATAQAVMDKIRYNPNETAVITSTIMSLSRNADFKDLTARLSVSEASGASRAIYSETKAISILMPGAAFTFNSYWNTGTSAPGTYPVSVEVKDQTGAVIALAMRNLVIASAVKPSAALKGRISVGKESILAGEPVAVSYNVTNIGNTDLADVGLSVQIVHVANQTVYDNLSSQATLSMGGTYAGSGTINTTTYSAMDYLAVLRVTIAGVEETLAGAYFRVEGAPTAPALIAPSMGSSVDTFIPALTVSNASDPNDDKLTYEFELYADTGLSQLSVASGLLSEGTGTTVWSVPYSLTENEIYFWRARAYDGKLYSPWMPTAFFRVNTVNDPPTAPAPTSPADGTSVSVLTPLLTVTNSTDPDSTGLTYNFDLALDPDFTRITATTTGVFEGPGATSWQLPSNLAENTWYYWRAQADDWQIEGPWSGTARFFVNTANDAPGAPVVLSPANGSSISTLATDITASNSIDPDSSVLTYFFELDTAPAFDSPNLVRSNGVAEGQETTLWNVAGLIDNTWYFVRTKASDGQAESPWSAASRFFANTTNDPPSVPVLANPSDGSGVNVFTPELSVYDSTDPDKDVLTYEFEIYADAGMTDLITRGAGIPETPQKTSWTVPISLAESQDYYWRCRAFDGIASSAWSVAASFYVNTANDAPGAPVLNAPAEASAVTTLTPALSIRNADDPESDRLVYDFELYKEGVLVQKVAGVAQNPAGVTSLQLTSDLADNTVYQWRARAYDGDRYGAWMAMASFTVHIPRTGISAMIDFDPNTLDKKSQGTWVTVYMEFPAGYNLADIDIFSIRFEGVLPAEPRPYAVGDHDKDGIPDLMVKFRRSDVISLLPNGDQVPVHVTGKMGTVTFEGVDIIRVMK